MNTETPIATDPQEAAAGSSVVKPHRVRKGREVIIGTDTLPSVVAAAERLGISESKLRKQLDNTEPFSSIRYADDAMPLPAQTTTDDGLSPHEFGDLLRAMLDEDTFRKFRTVHDLADNFPAQSRKIIAAAKATKTTKGI